MKKKKLDITVVVPIASPKMQKEAELLSGGQKEFEKWTGKTLNEEGENFKFPFIASPPDLTLPKSLNFVREKIKTKYIAFLHHDVWFLEDGHFLEKCVKYMDSLPDVGLAGVCGKSFKKPKLKEGEHFMDYEFDSGFTIGYGLYQRQYKDRNERVWFKGKYYKGATTYGAGRPIDKPVKVQTVDCMIMIIPTKVFKKIKFNEKLKYRCDCMCEDYCLAVNYYLGLNVYVLPLAAWHRPNWIRPPIGGIRTYVSEKYLKAVKILGEEWKDKVPCILSTSFWSGKNIFDWNLFMKWVKMGRPKEEWIQCY